VYLTGNKKYKTNHPTDSSTSSWQFFLALFPAAGFGSTLYLTMAFLAKVFNLSKPQSLYLTGNTKSMQSCPTFYLTGNKICRKFCPGFLLQRVYLTGNIKQKWEKNFTCLNSWPPALTPGWAC
jgi:hypothetical protein